MIGVKVAFSRVKDGNMSFQWGASNQVIDSRRSFIKKAGIAPEQVAGIRLVHGVIIVEPSDKDLQNNDILNPEISNDADGIMTNRVGVGLFFNIADCMPVVVYDPTNKAIALLHAGRIGVENNILASAMAKMSLQYGTKPNDVLMSSGPSIARESYIFDTNQGVDMDFWGQYFSLSSDNKYRMDIKGMALEQALSLGIQQSNIAISKLDTYTNTSYYSHRRSMATNGLEGRFAALVFMRP